MTERDLGRRIGACAQRLLGASEMALGIGEASHPRQCHAGHRERTDRDRLVGPAVLLGNGERPLAQLERERQRLPGERHHQREVCEASDFDERPLDPARAAERVFEAPARVVRAARPQLRDAQVHERECPVISRHRHLFRVHRGVERGFETAQRVLGAAQIAAPAGELELDDGQVHVEDAPSRAGNRRRQPARDLQPWSGLVQRPVQDAVDRERRREIGVPWMGVGREGSEQRVERLAPAGHRQREVVVDEQAPSRRPVTGGLVMADGFHHIALGFVPGGRGAVQRRNRRGRDASQLEAQQVGEQVVVAEPGTGGVECRDEGVLVLQPQEDRLGPRGAGESISQRAAHARQDRRPQQHVAHVRGLALEHLGEEVAGHGAFAARELGDEAFGVRVRAQRDRRQAHAGRPALGPLPQRGDGRVGQSHPAPLQHGASLLQREPQVRPAQLGELDREPHAVQAERRLVASHEYDP